jgi:hypothetical protein
VLYNLWPYLATELHINFLSDFCLLYNGCYTSSDEIEAGFREAWHDAMTGNTLPIEFF